MHRSTKTVNTLTLSDDELHMLGRILNEVETVQLSEAEEEFYEQLIALENQVPIVDRW